MPVVLCLQGDCAVLSILELLLSMLSSPTFKQEGVTK